MNLGAGRNGQGARCIEKPLRRVGLLPRPGDAALALPRHVATSEVVKTPDSGLLLGPARDRGHQPGSNACAGPYTCGALPGD